MSGSAGRASLFITLGIAAIDMLTCAFVSAIVLFFLFLVPKESAGASENQDQLFLHWSAKGASGVIIGITLERNGQRSVVWTDDLASVDKACPNLSKTPVSANACYLLNSGTGSPDQDGVLMIARPLAGQWSIVLTYADTVDNGNGGNYAPAGVRVTLVRDAAIDLTAEMAAGEQFDLASDSKQAAAVRQLLKVE